MLRCKRRACFKTMRMGGNPARFLRKPVRYCIKRRQIRRSTYRPRRNTVQKSAPRAYVPQGFDRKPQGLARNKEQSIEDDDDDAPLGHAGAGRRRKRSRPRHGDRCRPGGRRDDQGRHPPLAVGHDGDQRDDPEGRDADADRGAERQGGRARQEARGGGRRSRLELAAVRGKGPGAAYQEQVRGGIRLLDLGVPQVRPAGLRGAERHPLLPGPVRGRGVVPRTSSTPEPHPTSRRSRPSTTSWRTRT